MDWQSTCFYLAQMEESRAELVAAKAEIEDAGAANANLLAELEQAKQSVAENEQADESTQLQAELSSLRGKLDMMRKDLDLQSKDLEQSKAEVEELRTASSEMQQSRDSLKVELTMLSHSNYQDVWPFPSSGLSAIILQGILLRNDSYNPQCILLSIIILPPTLPIRNPFFAFQGPIFVSLLTIPCPMCP